MISRVIDNIQSLEEIPGARLIRVGERKLSLGELEVALQDNLRFKIGVLHTAVSTFGLYRNRALAESYVEDQLFSLDLDNKAGQGQVKVIGDALTTYAANRRGRVLRGRTDKPGPVPQSRWGAAQ